MKYYYAYKPLYDIDETTIHAFVSKDRRNAWAKKNVGYTMTRKQAEKCAPELRTRKIDDCFHVFVHDTCLICDHALNGASDLVCAECAAQLPQATVENSAILGSFLYTLEALWNVSGLLPCKFTRNHWKSLDYAIKERGYNTIWIEWHEDSDIMRTLEGMFNLK